MVILINGQFVDNDKASVNLFDLGFNRGHSIFEYFRFQHSKPRFLEEHLNRLMESIASSMLNIAFSKTEIEKMVYDAIDKSDFSNGSIRLTVTAGNSSNFSAPETTANIFLVSNQFNRLPANLYKVGAKLISREHKREFPSIKTTNYFYAQRHRNSMLNANAIDILYYDEYIRETSRANIFLVKNEEIFTPKLKILKGITRLKILSIFPSIKEVEIQPAFINSCDETFITSSSREVLPIVEIDGNKIGDGKVGKTTNEVIRKFSELINS